MYHQLEIRPLVIENNTQSTVSFQGENIKKRKKHKLPKNPEIYLETPTIEGIAKYIQEKPCNKIIVLTGAGVSTPSGLPDVRSPETGLYYSNKINLPYAHAIFENKYFKKNPTPLYRMLHEFILGTYRPTIGHFFIALLERKNVLLKNYTQNMDDLERAAGVSEDKLGQIFGSFNRFRCIRCRTDQETDWARHELLVGRVPQCDCGGTIKPKIYMYGEALPKKFCHDMAQDFRKCDLLIILGTTLSDQPVATMPFLVNKNCPRLVINKTKMCDTLEFDFSSPLTRDVMWLGDCNDGCAKLAELLGWSMELHELMDDTLNMNFP